MGWVSMRNNSS